MTNIGWVESTYSVRYPLKINCEKIQFEDL